jgi:serine/threonine protein phosphatase PrpC
MVVDWFKRKSKKGFSSVSDGFFCIFDGHSGDQASLYASQVNDDDDDNFSLSSIFMSIFDNNA